MKTLNGYIARSLLLITLIAIAVLTFVMLSANLLKAFELVARGVAPMVLLRFLLYLMPDMLTFTIPLSVLCASVLVFSRLSADNEITAMRASGISLWQIVAPGLIISLLLSALCLWLNTTVAPLSRYRADQLQRTEGVKNPLVLLEPGRFVELPGYIIRVERRDGNILEDIHVLRFSGDGQLQDITARQGRVRINQEERMLELDLEDATIATVDRQGELQSGLQRWATRNFKLPLDYGSEIDRKPLTRKVKYMDLPMIFAVISIESAHGGNVTRYYVEINKRLVLALSPLAFLLIGMPFGIRSRRSETSVGLLFSLLLALGFYVFLIMGEALEDKAQVHPELLVWLPNILYQIGGLWTLHTIAKR